MFDLEFATDKDCVEAARWVLNNNKCDVVLVSYGTHFVRRSRRFFKRLSKAKASDNSVRPLRGWRPFRQGNMYPMDIPSRFLFDDAEREIYAKLKWS